MRASLAGRTGQAIHRTAGVPLVQGGRRSTPLARPRRVRPVAPRAGGAQPPPPPPPPPQEADALDAFKAWTRTDVFRGPVQVAVFLIVFMVFDAAWSGDWSRIGAISKDTEAALKPVTGAIAAVHAASAAVAWNAASARGVPPAWPAVKAAAVGVLAALEAVWDEKRV